LAPFTLDRQGDEVERAAQYGKLTAKQKLEIVLVGLRGERPVRDLCREHEISETLYYRWRDQLLEAGGERLGGRRSAEASRSWRRGSPSWSGRSGARPMSVAVIDNATGDLISIQETVHGPHPLRDGVDICGPSVAYLTSP
jgi:transposase-like protein